MKKTLEECRRVIKVARKPDKKEFMLTAKVVGVGVIILGFIGMLVTMLFTLLLGV
jgi:protein transport protein SEC61 subunit gamma-like protein